MRKSDFSFPNSQNPLKAVQAAKNVGGESAYWDLFDALQAAFFAQSQNIADINVIKQCVESVAMDVAKWNTEFESPHTAKQVKADWERVAQFSITSVPTLVVDGKYKLQGSMPYELLVQRLQHFDKQ